MPQVGEKDRDRASENGANRVRVATARSASPPAALSLLRLRSCRRRRGNRQIPARAYRQEQRENLAIVEIVFVPTRAQRRDHHRERAMQHETALAFPDRKSTRLNSSHA